MLISLEKFGRYHLDPVNSRWSKPPPGYLKLNVDGGYRDSCGVFGGVLRNDDGEWLWGL